MQQKFASGAKALPRGGSGSGSGEDGHRLQTHPQRENRAAHKEKIGQPTKGNRAQNRALNRGLYRAL